MSGNAPLRGSTITAGARLKSRKNDSLHAMHRSYRIGRQSGSLSEERISMLTDYGFEFRDKLLDNKTVKTV